MTETLLVLVMGDHSKYFYLDGRCILADLPFKVLVLTSRASARHFPADHPAIEVAQVPWSDFAQVGARVAGYAGARRIRTLVTLHEGLLALAAQLRETFGWPGMSSAVTHRFRDKLAMKRAVHAAGLAVPEHAPCERQAAVRALLARHGRLVIKPVDGFGASRVTFIDGAAALARWYEMNGIGAGYEAERFVDATLYHVNAVVRAGTVLLTACAMYEPGMANVDFSAGTPFVSVMVEQPALRQRLIEFSNRVLGALGLQDGVTHLECFVPAAGAIVLCEVAARPGGGGIVEMIEAQYGVNFAHAALLLQSGRGDLLTLPATSGRPGLHGLMGFRLARNCVVERMADPDVFRADGMLLAQMLVKPGDFVPAARHCTDFVGLLVFASSDYADFSARVERYLGQFNAGLAVRP